MSIIKEYMDGIWSYCFENTRLGECLIIIGIFLAALYLISLLLLVFFFHLLLFSASAFSVLNYFFPSIVCSWKWIILVLILPSSYCTYGCFVEKEKKYEKWQTKISFLDWYIKRIIRDDDDRFWLRLIVLALFNFVFLLHFFSLWLFFLLEGICYYFSVCINLDIIVILIISIVFSIYYVFKNARNIVKARKEWEEEQKGR